LSISEVIKSYNRKENEKKNKSMMPQTTKASSHKIEGISRQQTLLGKSMSRFTVQANNRLEQEH